MVCRRAVADEATRGVTLQRLTGTGLAWAQEQVARHHYLRAPVPRVARPEAWAVMAPTLGRVGCLVVARPQATRVRGWYGSLNDLATGRCTVSYWQVLCLARVWLDPRVQRGGAWWGPDALPGYTDRCGRWHSTLASTALRLLVPLVGYEYLLARPPCYPDEPYEHTWLMSYCDTARHRGTIYRAAGWELYRTAEGVQTWRTPLPPLTPAQHAAVVAASLADARARRYRARRAAAGAQLVMEALA